MNKVRIRKERRRLCTLEHRRESSGAEHGLNFLGNKKINSAVLRTTSPSIPLGNSCTPESVGGLASVHTDIEWQENLLMFCNEISR